MGEALRETWFLVVLALLLGAALGYALGARVARRPSASPIAAMPTPVPTAVRTAVPTPVRTARPTEKQGTAASTPLPAASAASTTVARPAPRPAASKPAASKPAATRRAPKVEPTLDLAAAKTALGMAVKLDDLKLIEGIGPKIEALLKADGLTTWRALSRANVERLQGILDEAGPRFSTHNPGQWPAQAALLADGKWEDFKKLTDKLKGGR